MAIGLEEVGRPQLAWARATSRTPSNININRTRTRNRGMAT
jgi:hypothetical protein